MTRREHEIPALSQGDHTANAHRRPDPRLAPVILGALFIAAVAVLSLPQARGVSEAFGWMPLWLFALPLAAWLGLQAGRLGDRAGGRREAPRAVAARRGRGLPQARRRAATLPRPARRAEAA